MDQITIAIIEARKQDVFDVIDNQANKSLESLSEKNDEVEIQVKFIESAIEQTEFQLIRSLTTETLGFCETFNTHLIQHYRNRSPQETMTLNIYLGLISVKVHCGLTC